MPTLDCTHDTEDALHRVCAHLLENPENDHIRYFTGRGKEYRLLCEACTKVAGGDSVPWRIVYAACFATVEEEGWWEGIQGRPEVLVEPSSLAFVHQPVQDGINPADPLKAVQPVVEAEGSKWIGLTIGGELTELDLGNRTRRHITNVRPTELDLSGFVTLVCSADGQFIGVAETLGNRGVVIDVTSGQRTMRLQRDGVHSNVSPFPLAFVVHDGRTLLIYSRRWNRLDVFDPATGELLTERELPGYSPNPNPRYRLDFCGRLTVAPNQDYIADDGWRWSPFGVLTAWSVRRWLTQNVFEAEDGPTRRLMVSRWDCWGRPLCWLSNTVLAVWGYGENGDWMIPAVRLFDVVSGEELGWFAGPEVEGKPGRTGQYRLGDFGGRLFFDRYLFAISEQHGVSVWNTEKGTRLHQDTSFAPVTYHPVAREFLTLLPDGGLQLSRLTGER